MKHRELARELRFMTATADLKQVDLLNEAADKLEAMAFAKENLITLAEALKDSPKSFMMGMVEWAKKD